VLSNAAVNATGRVVSAGGRVEGNPAATTAPTTFTIGCPGGCRPTGTAPVTYTVNVRSGPRPDVGDVVTLASAPTTDLAYKVRRVDAVAGTIEVAALDGTNTTLEDGQVLTQTTRGAALLTSPSAGLPAGPDCETYACGNLDVAADRLFRETFGVGKQTFGGEIGAHYDTDACSGPVRWIDVPDGAAPTVTLGDCPSPRIVVVRAPPQSDVAGGPPVKLTVTLTPGSVFRGVLYVIGTHDLGAMHDSTRPPGSGSDITVSAVGGSFLGSVIAENAITDDQNAARTTTLSAVSTTAPPADGCSTPGGSTDVYAFCYDRGVLGSLVRDLNAALPESAKPRVAVARYSWAENGR
jgi:hypothetical protein